MKQKILYIIPIIALIIITGCTKSQQEPVVNDQIQLKPSIQKPQASVEHPDNTSEVNPSCPKEWLGHDFSDSYLRNDGIGKQHVCDYKGSVTTAECIEAQAMLTAGPHGVWCQKYQNGKKILLSLARIR